MAKDVSAVKVEKFVITIGDKTLELTPSQALELRDILNKTMGSPIDELKKALDELSRKKEKEYIPMPYPQPYPVWPTPVQPRPYWREWEIICSSPATATNYSTCSITCKV